MARVGRRRLGAPSGTAYCTAAEPMKASRPSPSGKGLRVTPTTSLTIHLTLSSMSESDRHRTKHQQQARGRFGNVERVQLEGQVFRMEFDSLLAGDQAGGWAIGAAHVILRRHVGLYDAEVRQSRGGRPAQES